jgi:predicted enzyme related to lactoylglutathione lyase
VTVIPGMVTMALFEDPEGNRIGIVASEPPPAE